MTLYELITALGSLGTVGAFIVVIINQKGSKKQIQELSDVAESIKRQTDIMLLSTREKLAPKLVIRDITYDLQSKLVTFTLNNEGAEITILDITSHMGDFTVGGFSAYSKLGEDGRALIFMDIDTFIIAPTEDLRQRVFVLHFKYQIASGEIFQTFLAIHKGNGYVHSTSSIPD